MNGKGMDGRIMPKVPSPHARLQLSYLLPLSLGIWLRPNPAADPCLTLFGSTNLNSRSANLDTELSFFLATACPSLRRRLGAEVDGLRAHALPWRGGDRHVRLGTRALVALVGGML